MCTTVNMHDEYVIHHEMGHVEYYMAYREVNSMMWKIKICLDIQTIIMMMNWGSLLQHQPYIFRDGANHAFHEAVGDTIALSFVTPEHLHTVGLLKNIPNESDGNWIS